MNDYESDEDISDMSEESDIEIMAYEDPDEFSESIEDIENLIEEAFADVTESYGEKFIEDDYGIDML